MIDLWDERARLEGLVAETRDLVRLLDDEIGRRDMSIGLRFKLEAIELILGERGTNAYVSPL